LLRLRPRVSCSPPGRNRAHHPPLPRERLPQRAPLNPERLAFLTGEDLAPRSAAVGERI
jgi:hypothetical protein